MKRKNRRLGGLLQPLNMQIWKWDDISIDFVLEFLRTKMENDTLWVIVDRLIKSTRFIAIQKKVVYLEVS